MLQLADSCWTWCWRKMYNDPPHPSAALPQLQVSAGVVSGEAEEQVEKQKEKKGHMKHLQSSGWHVEIRQWYNCACKNLSKCIHHQHFQSRRLLRGETVKLLMLSEALSGPLEQLYSLILHKANLFLPLTQKIASPLIRTHPGKQA